MLTIAEQSSARDYLLLCLPADTAMRVGALSRIKVKDVNLAKRKVVVHEKGDQCRVLKFGERTAQALVRYLNERPENAEPYLFIGQRGTPLKPGGIYQVFKRLARRAGVYGRFNPHAIRHAFAIHALENGADLKAVQQLLGHKGIEVTARSYARYKTDALDAIHDRVSLLAPKKEDKPSHC